MGIESPTYISQLNALWPLGTDDRSTVDDHLRLIKAAVQASFPAITGAVSATHTELNLNVGNTKTIGAALQKFSLSISANSARIATLSLSVATISASLSAVITQSQANNAKLTSISALNTGYTADLSTQSASIVALRTSLSAINTRLTSLSASAVVMLDFSGTTAQSLTALPNAGFQKLPGGLTLQWRVFDGPAVGPADAAAATMTFAFAFSNAALVVIPVAADRYMQFGAGYTGYTSTFAILNFVNIFAATLSANAVVFAIGY